MYENQIDIIRGKWVKEHHDGSGKIETIDIIEYDKVEGVHRCAFNPLKVPSKKWLENDGWVRADVYTQFDNPYTHDEKGNSIDIRSIVAQDDKTIQITPKEQRAEEYREQIKSKHKGKTMLENLLDNEDEDEDDKTAKWEDFTDDKETPKTKVKKVVYIDDEGGYEDEKLTKEEELIRTLLKFNNKTESVVLEIVLELPISINVLNTLLTNMEDVNYSDLAKALLKHSSKNINESIADSLKQAFE